MSKAEYINHSYLPVWEKFFSHVPLTIAGLARELDIPYPTVYYWTQSDRIPTNMVEKFTKLIEKYQQKKGVVIQMNQPQEKPKAQYARLPNNGVIEKGMEVLGLNKVQFAAEVGYSDGAIGQYIKENQAPKVLIDYVKLIIKSKTKEDKNAGSDMIVCFVPKIHSVSFASICQGLGIDFKKFL